MTRIRFGRTEDGLFSFVDLQGHAGFADEGEDIVCSAVTSAIQFAHILLDDVLGIAFETHVDPESTQIRFDFPPASCRSAQDICKALLIHYKEIQENYPDFIQVTEVYSHAEN